MIQQKERGVERQHEACLNPCDTAMTRRSDESSPAERNGVVLAVLRGEGLEVHSFAQVDAIRKPLVAFEASPANTPPPLTWESTSS